MMATMTKTEKALERNRKWRKDPVMFVRDNFAAEPDAWQADVLAAAVVSPRVAMKSCKGPGKTCVLAWLIWWFMATRRHPKVACTSISGANLDDCLWNELAYWQNKSEFLRAAFVWKKTRIYAKDHPETWWCSARQWSQSADKDKQADTLAGLHGKHLLFVLDEAGGIPDGVMAAAEAALATGGDTKIVMAGNPTQVSGPLWRACTEEADLWHVTEITGDPDDPKRSPRVSKEWAETQIRKYGKDNPWVLVNVFGKFPPSAINTLLGPEDIAPAFGKHLKNEEYSWDAKLIGVDVARFGDDRTVITPRQGRAAAKPIVMRGARTDEIAARVAKLHKEMGAQGVMVDGTGGWGAGVIDALRLAGVPVFEINSSSAATDPRYFNLRAEMHFKLAEWVKTGGSLAPEEEYKRELTAPTYTFQGGKFRLEAKDQIKERLGESPDMADSLALTFAIDVVPELHPLSPLGRQVQVDKVETEWDPQEMAGAMADLDWDPKDM